MRSRTLLLAVPVLAGLVPAAPADVAPTLTILRADVRFDPRGGSDSRIALKGDLTGGTALTSFDPGVTPLRITMGPLTFLDGPPWSEGTRTRWTEDGYRLDVRAPDGQRGRMSMTLYPASGAITLRATGVDANALLGAGPGGVVIEVTVGGDVFATTIDFEAKGDRKWSYRLPPPSRTPPPGGGGGGGGGGGIVTLAQGEWSGITSTRFEVVRDQSAWDALWLEHAGGGTPPSVDFSSEMVVGLWLGYRPTGGYTVDIFRITAPYTVIVGGWCPPPSDPPIGAPCFGGAETPGFLVEARETQPGPRCIVTTAATLPFHIVRAPRVEGPGVFSLLSAVRDCP